MTLHVRWLGRVPYGEGYDLQRALFAHAHDNYLLLLEHEHVYTLGVRADLRHVLVDPATVGAELVPTDRGGDVTYHGPGQLTGYPILSLTGKRGGGMADTVAYVRTVEQLVIDTLAEVGLPNAGRLRDYPGVWIDPASDNPRKIAAIGVKLTRGRTMHGFALNVNPDMTMFTHIVPCGIEGKAVTSIAQEGIDAPMRRVVDIVTRRAGELWGDGAVERQDVAWKHSVTDLSAFSRGEGAGEPVRLSRRLESAGVTDGLSITTRKPDWMRVKAEMGPQYRELRKTIKELSLVTVCEEAGCPNIYECWADGTATFMVLGERCTRACGFCLVDTSKPLAADTDEPERVAEAIERMGLQHAVLTMVARDDLADGGMAHVAACIEAIRRRTASTKIETLISDAKGSASALDVLFAAEPDVMNHNVETVPRLQRAVRPSAGYARSLGVLSRAKRAGLITKSGLVVGMGETDDEVYAVLADLASIGVDIVTIGQYLRPTTNHLPIARWVAPDQFAEYARVGEKFGIGHVESSPLTRSSYHAKSAASGVVGAISGVAPSFD
ncbi:MAG: lipoyl synthase [Acidimicrobiia bacterium]